jgi:hypothetical protein
MLLLPAVLLALLTLAVVLAVLTLRAQPQHTGSGEGALSVWQLRDRLAAESVEQAAAGRHPLHASSACPAV